MGLLLKAIDRSKLTKRVITDKKGRRTTVWVKTGKDNKTKTYEDSKQTSFKDSMYSDKYYDHDMDDLHDREVSQGEMDFVADGFLKRGKNFKINQLKRLIDDPPSGYRDVVNRVMKDFGKGKIKLKDIENLFSATPLKN